ncbi:MAG: hypothetical protein VW333_06455, partial [Pseudomonadales bacterium]
MLRSLTGLAVIALAALFFYFTGTRDVPVASEALAEDFAPLIELTNDEANNISVFETASPSVVFVTNTQLRRRRFS